MVLLDHGCGVPPNLTFAPPPSDLRALVEHVWVQEHAPGRREWRVVPDTAPHLIAAITEGPEGRRLRVSLVGPRSCMAPIDCRGRAVTVGVRLTAGAIPAIVSESARDFVDRAVPIADVCPDRILTDLELSADAPASVVANQLLLVIRRAARARVPGETAACLARVAGVRGLVEALDRPERTLRDQSYAEIGFSPKRALRIMRLHKSLWTARPRVLSLAAVAHAAGYSDQAHWTRECRLLLSDTPAQWLRRADLPICSRPAAEPYSRLDHDS